MRSTLARIICSAVVALVSGPLAAQTTVTLQEGLSGYVGTTDSYVGSFLADDNDGADNTSLIGTSSEFGMLRFPIFAHEGGPVPNNANITSATLSVYKSAGPDSVFKAARLLKNWNEMQSTWNQAAIGMAWQTAGATGALDVLSTQDGQGSIGAAAGWVSINVTSSVQAFAGGTFNYGWKFSWVSGSTSAKTFITRSHPSSPTLRPKLAVTYTLGSAGLPAPQNLDAGTSGTSITLRWNDMSSDETLFKIERKTGQGGTYAEIGTVAANSIQYTDSTGTVNSTYFYRLRASNGATNGPYSNEAGVTLTSSSNDGGWTMDYKYDHFGNLVESKVGTIATTITYDLRGRKTAMADPDMGSWTYAYDALGQLKSQTDAKSQTSTMAYDLLGRMTTRTEPDLVSTWTYDACTKGVGKLCQASSDNGYNRTYTYDSLGRVSQSATGFDNTIYNVDYTYDSSGRVSTVSYPTGFVAKQVYNSYGYQHQLTNSSGTLVYWQANSMSATGRVLTETLGNGLTGTRSYDTVDRQATSVVSDASGALQNFSYTWDGVGNLVQRIDAQQSVTENFSYDKLNRLDLSSGPNLVTKSFSYDQLGNITYRSDVGTYTYGARPHAVSSVSGSLNASYTYDSNGNMTGGNGRTFTYTSFNMPVTITGNSYTYTYTYGPDHERVRLVHSTLGTFIYLNPGGGELLYEKETKPGGLIEHKHYLSVGGSSVGVYLSRSDATSETRYFHHDHIGSLTLVTNASGAVLERMAYEAFGKRRFPNGTDDPNNTLMGLTTDRGFTMHEHLDEVALVHMNGRIYDPLLARFITPDPFIQAPYNLQSHNRYSYGFNNPLRNYDPSGFIHKKLKAAWDDFREDVKEVFNDVVETAKDIANAIEENLPAIIAIGAAAFTGFVIAPALGLGSIGAGALSGFVGGYVGSGGNIEAAIIGGLTGAAFGAIGAANLSTPARVAAHATVGCVSSAASGGSCASGAVAAGFSKLAQVNGFIPDNPVGGTIASAIVGGTASVLGGGKFANGAVTASFGYLFNAMSQNGGAALNTNEATAEATDERILLAGRTGVDCQNHAGPVCSGGGGYGFSAPAPRAAPDFVVTPGGTAYPVPQGASGPVPVINSSGRQTGSAFTGGSAGANGQVDTIRIMNPNLRNPTGYIRYENSRGQGVNPYTGRTGTLGDTHYPIDR